MSIVLLAGGRTRESESYKALSAALEGVLEGGAKGELIHLGAMDIAFCRECADHGRLGCKPDGQCKLEDDFEKVLQKLLDADAVVFSSPVHFTGMGSSLRAFFHRLQQVCRHEDTRTRLEGKMAMGVFIGGGASQSVKKLRKIMEECGFSEAGMITMPRQSVKIKKEMLHAAGKQLASGGQYIKTSPEEKAQARKSDSL